MAKEAQESELFIRDEITVEHDYRDAKTTYIFRIPSPMQQAKIGIVARNLRMQDDPETVGSSDGLDSYTYELYYAAATFKTMYIRGDNSWVMSPNEAGQPECIPDNWPADAPLVDVFEKYMQEVERFREGKPSA